MSAKINLTHLREEVLLAGTGHGLTEIPSHDVIALIDTVEAALALTSNWKAPEAKYLPTERRLRETLDRFTDPT